MRIRFLLLPVSSILSLCFTTTVLKAQSFIPLETKDNAIVLEVTGDHYLNMVYFGKKLSDKNEYQNVPQPYHTSESNMYSSAYTTAGTRDVLEPAIAVTHADGNKSLDLKYVDQSVNKLNDDVSQVDIQLKDPVYDMEVALHYKLYSAENVVEQWSTITNHEKRSITLNKYASANLYLQA
jgi:alpha-galactosidase